MDNCFNFKYLAPSSYLVLGEVEDGRQQDDIEEEHRRHGDILQATFKDSYRNLTYKHLSGYRYNQCTHKKVTDNGFNGFYNGN